MGEYARAARHHEAGLALWHELGNRWRVALALTNHGVALHHLGEHDGALALHEESLGVFRALDNGWGSALALGNLGRLRWARGDRARAVEHLSESLALSRQIDNSGGIITALGDLGRAAHAEGDTSLALAYLHEALTRCQKAHDRSRLPAPLEGLATVVADQGRVAEATRLLGAADALRTGLGKPRPPDEQRAYAAVIAALRVALGDDTFAVARAAGQALGPDEALTAALALVPDMRG